MNNRIIVARHQITSQTVCVLVWPYHQLVRCNNKVPTVMGTPTPNLRDLHQKALTFAHKSVHLLGLHEAWFQPAFRVESGVSVFWDWLPFAACFYLFSSRMAEPQSGKQKHTNLPKPQLGTDTLSLVPTFIPLTKTNHMVKPNPRGQRTYSTQDTPQQG